MRSNTNYEGEEKCINWRFFSSAGISPRLRKGIQKFYFLITAAFLLLVGCKKNEELPENGAGCNPKPQECVIFVKAQLSITGSTANAKDWGISYMPPGFSKVSSLRKLDLVVFGEFFPQFANQYGHIGIIWDVKTLTNDETEIVLLSSNVQGDKFTLCCATNVTLKKVLINNANRQHVWYLHKDNVVLNCPPTTGVVINPGGGGPGGTGNSAGIATQPAIGTWVTASTNVNCPFGTVEGNVVRFRIKEVNTSQRKITFEVAKSDGANFLYNGTSMIKPGSYCITNNYAHADILGGSNSATMIFDYSFIQTGTTIDFYGFHASSGGPVRDFAGGVMKVTF